MSIIKFKLTPTSITLEEDTKTTFEQRADGWYCLLDGQRTPFKIEEELFVQKKEDYEHVKNKNACAYAYVQKDMIKPYLQFLMDSNRKTISETKDMTRILQETMQSNTYRELLQALYDKVTSCTVLQVSDVASIHLNEYLDLDSEEGINYPFDYDWHRSTFDHLAGKDIAVSFGHHREQFACYIDITSRCSKELFVDTVQKEFLNKLKQDHSLILTYTQNNTH